MLRNYITLSLLFGLSFSTAQANDEHAHHWSYKGSTAPNHWAELSEEYFACKLGKGKQSPINIQVTKKVGLAPLEMSYQAGAASIINNGHTVQVNLQDAGYLMLDGAKYSLKQFHFHTPSEERIHGHAFPLEAHLVHQDEKGNLAVIAVMFEAGQDNTALTPIFTQLPKQADGQAHALAAAFNPQDLLPKQPAYYQYQGSLTTPPCTEGVKWQVMKQPVQLGKQQIAAFRKLYKFNARPVQPLNGRVVEE